MKVSKVWTPREGWAQNCSCAWGLLELTFLLSIAQAPSSAYGVELSRSMPTAGTISLMGHGSGCRGEKCFLCHLVFESSAPMLRAPKIIVTKMHVYRATSLARLKSLSWEHLRYLTLSVNTSYLTV
jgi:hypothetical protein